MRSSVYRVTPPVKNGMSVSAVQKTPRIFLTIHHPAVLMFNVRETRGVFGV